MKGCPTMSRLLHVAVALLAAGAASPAAATWIQCGAAGTDSVGAFAFETTSADVGALPPARRAQLEQQLRAYVAKTDAGAQVSGAACTPFDDVVAASSHYSQVLNATARRIGWGRVTVVHPDDWLAPNDIVADPSRP